MQSQRAVFALCPLNAASRRPERTVHPEVPNKEPRTLLVVGSDMTVYQNRHRPPKLVLVKVSRSHTLSAALSKHGMTTEMLRGPRCIFRRHGIWPE
jgi:hypothetical protein